VQFYDKLSKDERLDERTPYSGSFKFRMKSDPGRAVAGMGALPAAGDNSFLSYLQTELRYEKEKNQELTETVADLEDEIVYLKEESKPKEKITGMIGQIGEATTQYPILGEIFKDLVSRFFPKGNNQETRRETEDMAGALAGVDTDTPPDVMTNNAIKKLVSYYIAKKGTGATDEEKKQSGFAAFAKDMHRLASLTDKPTLFNSLISMLENFG
jgi:hypothetical protein